MANYVHDWVTGVVFWKGLEDASMLKMKPGFLGIETFEAGTIVNPLRIKYAVGSPRSFKIKVRIPARVNAMCFDPGSLANPNKRFIYTAGELAFSAGIYTSAEIDVIPDGNARITITPDTKRKSIVLHAALIMQNALDFKDSLVIRANNEHGCVHCGLGSSSALQTATCMAINAIYGNPIPRQVLMKFLPQNYGEEISGEDKRLIHIQSNGGGPAVALYGGGMVALAGEGVVIKRNKIPFGFSFVFGIPPSYRLTDAKEVFEREKSAALPLFKKSSIDRGHFAAHLILHKLLPAMEEEEISTIGDVIQTYRFECGSLFNTGQVWPEMLEKMNELIGFRKTHAIEILSTSSVGPVIYALTTKPSIAEKIFEEHGLKVFKAPTDNKGAVVSLA